MTTESTGAREVADPRRVAAERTTENFLRHVSFERGLSENTVDAYRRDLVSYTDWLVAHRVSDIASLTESDVSDYIGSLASRTTEDGTLALSSSSVARMLSSVRSLHRYLLREGLVTEDVTRDLTPPKKSQRLPKAITVEQMSVLLGAVTGDDPIAVRDRTILELLYATGARVSELTGLTVDDVLAVGEDAGEGDESVVNLIRVIGKGSKQRIVPFGSYAKAALDAYLVRSRPVLAARGKGTPSLFLGSRGAPLSRQSVWLVIQSAAEAADLGVELSPHTFRHSFATHLLQGGADVRTVQELLGHSSVATTQIYTLVTADTLRDMYVTAHPRAR